MTLNEAFESAYVINLRSRPDRLKQFDDQAKRIGLKYQRFSAYIGGYKGCTESHVSVIKQAWYDRNKSCLVFEDDAVFHENFNELFDKFYSELPNDWHGILLGFNHQRKPEQITDNVVKVKCAYAMHCYILRESIYPEFIAKLEGNRYACDISFSEMHDKYNIYAPTKPLVWQSDGFSDIEKKEVSYPFLKETGSLQVYNQGKYTEEIKF
jgi:GR25 family glycosyltransferase involved in LPS biosynthesis